MKCVVVMEGRFGERNGRPVSSHLTYDRFWSRYLMAFEEVVVLARVGTASHNEGAFSDGPGVTFIPVPSYQGLTQFLGASPRITKLVKSTITPETAVILRVPGLLGTVAHLAVRASGQPYAVELVGDPYDVFAPGVVSHPLRPLIRWGLARATQMQARDARGVAYVTERALQERYPCAEFQTAISSVELPEEALVTDAASRGACSGPFTLVTVGSLAQPYKGVDVLIDAVAMNREAGRDVELKVVGDGRYRPALEAQAQQRGVADHVDFMGQLPAGEAVRDVLDDADVFVMASRTEGLPRAMIEAMARALPCIGTRVGGIPELLPDEYLIPPDDAKALAARIQAVADADEAVLREAAARNLEVARRYRLDILNERRSSFYQHVREATASWQREHR